MMPWSTYRRVHPKIRIRDAARALGTTEAQLLASDCDGDTVTRLQPRWTALVPALATLGTAKTITRNESAVLERIGRYGEISIDENSGIALGALDLRMFPRVWRSAFAVVEESERGARRSIQLFDRFGDAVHKAYLEPGGDVAAFEALRDELRAPDQSPHVVVDAPRAPAIEVGELDREALREGWDAMRDTHEFVTLLRRLGTPRLVALQAAGRERARRVDNRALSRLLSGCASTATPIMIFVGNRGMIQIHTGPIARVVDAAGWLNVLDPEFNLHVRSADVAETWVVRKPTRDGIVTSLELYDRAGETIALVFGRRKPGTPEREEWREQLAAATEMAS
jgi:putative hemin transport protein